MKAMVCIKQVPGTNKVEVDSDTGVLKRDGIEAKMNPYDLYALETALLIKEQTGGTVSVITMGPPQAEAIIREAYSMGADEGFLLTDRAFAGADVLATSRALSQGIKMAGDFDLIICGKQSTDGDTAQVGPEISEWLKIDSVTNVTKVIEVGLETITVKKEISTAVETLKLTYPCLMSVEKDISIPRLPSYIRKKATADRKITYITLNNLEDKDPKSYGLNGSPTQVQRIFPPETNDSHEMWCGDSEELAARMSEKLRELKLI